MPQWNRSDRVRGCMLGLAVGDALGAPLEGLSSQQIRAHYGQVDDFVDGARAWKKKPYRWRMPGLYSDDTQQALALSDVLLECQTIDPDRLASIYLGLANPKGSYVGAHRGVGRSFRQVLADLERGVSPRLTGQRSAGIGAAMRIAPVALYFMNKPEGMFEAVMAASLMTHRDIRSLSGAMAVAHAVRRLAAGEPRDPSFLFRVAADVARDEERIAAYDPQLVEVGTHLRSMPQAIAHVERLLDMPREQAFSALVEEANRHGADPVCKRPTMGFPPACIPTCLFLLITTESLEEALVEVVNLGGDADSAGAILGAFAGAHYGIGCGARPLAPGPAEPRGDRPPAPALTRGSTDGLPRIPDLVRSEHDLSALEVACRENLLAHSQNGGDLGANRRL
ncbi:MAG: ADP-ribosylglycohydrolase family protein [Isosphaeraceae bacterium]